MAASKASREKWCTCCAGFKYCSKCYYANNAQGRHAADFLKTGCQASQKNLRISPGRHFASKCVRSRQHAGWPCGFPLLDHFLRHPLIQIPETMALYASASEDQNESLQMPPVSSHAGVLLHCPSHAGHLFVLTLHGSF